MSCLTESTDIIFQNLTYNLISVETDPLTVGGSVSAENNKGKRDPGG
jgi:hypothetical protein